MLAMAGATLVLASQAQAQTTYADQDLLLNFRNYTTQTDNNVAVDEGTVANLIAETIANGTPTTVGSLSGATLALDEGAQNGYTPVFAAADLNSELGTPATGNKIGFSAAGTIQSAATLWLSRIILSPTLDPTSITQSGQAPNQITTANDITSIGLESKNNGTTLGPSSTSQAVYYSSGDPESYQKIAESGTANQAQKNTINYGGSQLTTSGSGGVIEQQNNGSANIYEALWEVPEGSAGSGGDTFEGYFTYQPDGEVDFTTTAAPEPSTYALLVLTGLAGFVMRRQIRATVK
jgi:hypothetical protein